MEKYIFTQKGYDVLKETIENTAKILAKVTRDKANAGSDQDGWHDEGFKIGVADEMMWGKRLSELQTIMQNATIVSPEEQNKVVKFGNGITIQYQDGSIFSFILGGYNIGIQDEAKPEISIYSPLGKTVLGAKIKETRHFQKSSVRIKKILPPLKADEIFQGE